MLHRELPHILGSEPPFDVLALCRHFCIDAFTYPFAKSIDGCLIRDGSYYAIGVNCRHSRERRRFSAAHELYHYLVHRWKMPDMSYLMSAGEDHEDEDQASAFAAELLMPQQLVVRCWVRWKHFRPCAEAFGVSRLAMERRLRELRLVRRGFRV